MPSSDIQYDKFMWHFGVVEDRFDPLRLGRVRVRFYGVHTEDKSKVPTEALPWATMINPVFSASVSGVGGPHNGIVEGAWVIGFFVDQDSYQKPFILGTIAGIPSLEPNPDFGFNDPFGVFPKSDNDSGYNGLNESDTSRLSRGAKTAETHDSLITRRNNRIFDIPSAAAYKVESVQDPKADEFYIRPHFDEPTPTGSRPTTTKYPFNKVTETESGHVFEVDDTADAERLHTYHTAGTYQEIVADGSRTTKVVGSDFDITVKDKNVYIGGNCSVTVIGDARLLVKGDMITEVDGNYVLSVRKDKIEKIQGNHITEILSDRNTQINGNNAIRIKGNDITNIIGNETISIGGNRTETIVGNSSITIISSLATSVIQKHVLTIGGTSDYGVAGTFNIATANVLNMKSVGNMLISTDADQTITVTGTQDTTATVTNINNDVSVTGTVDASTDVLGGGADISLVNHVHTEQGDGADVSKPK